MKCAPQPRRLPSFSLLNASEWQSCLQDRKKLKSSELRRRDCRDANRVFRRLKLVKPDPAFHSRHGAQELLRIIIADGGRVGFLFSYDPAMAEACGTIFKPLHGYYAKELKAWIAR
jgi:hypothetical protein